MVAKAEPIPPGYHRVNVVLVVEDIGGAIEFYKQAFGAEEISRFEGPDGKLMHAEVRIGDTRLMLGSECPTNRRLLPPTKLQGASSMLYLYLPNAEAAYDRALSAGAKSVKEVEDTFWGDRLGEVEDPYGQYWALATHIEDLTEEQIRQRAEEFFTAKAGAR